MAGPTLLRHAVACNVGLIVGDNLFGADCHGLIDGVKEYVIQSHHGFAAKAIAMIPMMGRDLFLAELNARLKIDAAQVEVGKPDFIVIPVKTFSNFEITDRDKRGQLIEDFGLKQVATNISFEGFGAESQ